MKKSILLFVVFTLALHTGRAQELQARLQVAANKVSSQVDKKIFQTLQTSLTNFLNSRKWTTNTYQPQEKIKCNFLITIDKELGQNVYQATLTVQAARPVYNTSYESPLVNFQDNDVVFRYVEFQPVEFNENRVQGNDPLAANLTAVLAFYVNIILGMDYDSFTQRGGDPYFQKAQNIVNNAPENRDITGWKTFDGLRNRFRLVENFTDSRFALVHNAIYTYYRTGFDLFFENEDAGRAGVLNALEFLNNVNGEIPNAMVMAFFFGGKGNELSKMFSRAPDELKVKARDLLLKLDVTNAAVYKELR